MKSNLPKKFTKIKKLVALTCLVFIFIISGIVNANNSSDQLIQEKTEELNRLLDIHKKRIEEKKEQARTLKQEIELIEAQAKEVEQKIAEIQAQLDVVQQEFDYIQNEISLNEALLKREQDKLKKGIKLLYERGSAGTIEVLASSGSISSVINQEKYLLSIDEEMASSIKQIKVIKKNLEIKKNELDIKKQEQESLKQEQERQKSELNTRIMSKNRLLEQTKGEERLYQQLLDQALSDKQNVGAILAALSNGSSPAAIGLPYSGMRAGQRVFRGEVIAKMGNTGFSTGPHLHFGVYRNGQDVDPMPLLSTGMFNFPVPGSTITQDFYGAYSHKGRGPGWPGGIDFAAAESTPIRAAREGVIIFDGTGRKGVNSGFGHYMIIDHQNGYLSLYAHLK